MGGRLATKVRFWNFGTKPIAVEYSSLENLRSIFLSCLVAGVSSVPLPIT